MPTLMAEQAREQHAGDALDVDRGAAARGDASPTRRAAR